jgi:16S rRNA (adenine1518-N6/adenine1519-N6)-dimethyltransferase
MKTQEIKLDQHFMNNDLVLNKIVAAAKINSKDFIFEIGPGNGSLTKKLLERNFNELLSVEKDENLKSELEKIKDKKFKLIIDDGLVQIDKYKFTKLIANIPYSITEPLYTKILDKTLDYVILLHGIDFYKNIVERETKWNYFVNAFYELTLIEEVPGELFEPPTKVKSVVVKLQLKDMNLTKKEEFFRRLWERKARLCKNAIQFSLLEAYGMNKKDAKLKVEKLDLDKKTISTKIENLSNEEFLEVIRKLNLK